MFLIRYELYKNYYLSLWLLHSRIVYLYFEGISMAKEKSPFFFPLSPFLFLRLLLF